MTFLEIKPRIKKAYPVIYRANQVMISGFGDVTTYDDADGAVTAVIKLLNGTHSLKQIENLVTQEFPTHTAEEIEELINDLNSEHFLEDVENVGAETLPTYALKRYHRNINFFSSYISIEENKYEFQTKLLNATVGIIGLGGLGSHIVYDLACLGIGKIEAIEFDVVDETNLNRQILYNNADIGNEKGKLAQQRLQQFNPHVEFNYHKIKVTSATQIEAAFKNVDVIVLVADRPKYELANWVNEAAVHLNVPLFCAGLEGHRALEYMIRPHTTGCINCWRQEAESKMDQDAKAFNDIKREKRMTGDNTAIVPLVSLATGMLCTEVLKYLTGIGELVSAGNLLSVDFDTMQIKTVESWKLNPNCSVCGG